MVKKKIIFEAKLINKVTGEANKITKSVQQLKGGMERLTTVTKSVGDRGARLNRVLKEENSAYRVVKNKIVQMNRITDVDFVIAIAVTRFKGIGGRSFLENVSD